MTHDWSLCIVVIFFFQPKCDLYWPDSGTETYGDMLVSLLREDILASYTLRTFSIRYMKPNVSTVSALLFWKRLKNHFCPKRMIYQMFFLHSFIYFSFYFFPFVGHCEKGNGFHRANSVSISFYSLARSWCSTSCIAFGLLCEKFCGRKCLWCWAYCGSLQVNNDVVLGPQCCFNKNCFQIGPKKAIKGYLKNLYFQSIFKVIMKLVLFSI